MRHFKIFDAVFLTEVNPAFQTIKVEMIFAVLYCDLNKLNCCTFSSNCDIKRRCEHWCQEHVASAGNVFRKEVLNDLPVFFRKCVYMIVVSKTVSVEPFCMDQILFRKNGVNDCYFCRSAAYDFIFAIDKLKFDWIYSGSGIFRNNHIEPDAAPFVRICNNCIIF